MNIDSWEEFVKYDWEREGTELEVELIGNILYYTIKGESERHRWLNTKEIDVSRLARVWTPIPKSNLTPQERVCKKIALMEQRWLNYQQRKQHG